MRVFSSCCCLAPPEDCLSSVVAINSEETIDSINLEVTGSKGCGNSIRWGNICNWLCGTILLAGIFLAVIFSVESAPCNDGFHFSETAKYNDPDVILNNEHDDDVVQDGRVATTALPSPPDEHYNKTTNLCDPDDIPKDESSVEITSTESVDTEVPTISTVQDDAGATTTTRMCPQDEHYNKTTNLCDPDDIPKDESSVEITSTESVDTEVPAISTVQDDAGATTTTRMCPQDEHYNETTRLCDPDILPRDDIVYDDSDSSDSAETVTGACPPDEEYCKAFGGCILNGATCPVCTLGESWCEELKMCKTNCSDLCPETAWLTADDFEWSSCLDASQCPTLTGCCWDKNKNHQRCVHPNGVLEEDPATQLEKSCTTPASDEFLTPLTCKEPKDCPKESICCSGNCKSLVWKVRCLQGYFKCKHADTCIENGADSCEEVCVPPTVFCTMLGKCAPRSECEGEHQPGLAWIPKAPVYVNAQADSIQGFKLSETWSRGKGQDELGAQQAMDFQVSGVSSVGWQVKKEGNNDWEQLKNGNTVSSKDLLRVLPSMGINIEYLNLTLSDVDGTILPYRVIQFVVPELPPPKISITYDADGQFAVQEDSVFTKQVESFAKVDGGSSFTDLEWLWKLMKNSISPELDIAHPVVAYIKQCVTVKRRDLGMRLKFSESASGSLAYSSNGGQSSTMVKTGQVADVMLTPDFSFQVTPKRNYFGVTSLDVTPFALDYGAYKVEGKPTKAKLEVTPINDAPIPKRNFDEDLLPVLKYKESGNGNRVSTYSQLFYTDVDNVALGIAVLFAQVSELGKWQWSKDGRTWNDITMLTADPLSGINLMSDYIGIVNIRQFSQKLSCSDAENCMESLSDVPNELGMSLQKFQMKLRRLSKLKEGEKNNQPESNTIDDGLLSAKQNAFSVNPIYLEPDYKLRYLPAMETTWWNKFDAMKKTRLLFTAWDMASVPKEENLINLPLCNDKCGNTTSLSEDFGIVYMPMRDCTNMAITSKPTETNECGLCDGGTTCTSCTDCAGVAGGAAAFECGKCVGGTSEQVSQKNCAGQCWTENILYPLANMKICIPKEQQFVMFCDGSSYSGAYINQCGVCVGGNTGKGSSSGLDNCAVCDGEDKCIGCDGVVNSGFKTDFCGKCLSTSDPEWNNCLSIAEAVPSVLDRAVIKEGFVNLYGAGLDPNKITEVQCDLTRVDGRENFRVNESIVQEACLTLEFTLPPTGTYNAKCSSKEGEILSEGVSIDVVDSKQLSVTAVHPTNAVVDVPIEVVLTVPNVTADSNILCFVCEKGSDIVQIISTKSVQNGEVTCKQYVPKKAKIMEFGVAATDDAAMDRTYHGTVGAVSITSPSPKALKTSFSSDLRQVWIDFDHNVDGPSSCETLFTPSVLKRLGNNPACSFVANRLIIMLGERPDIYQYYELELSPSNGIRRKDSDSDLAMQASGKIMLQVAPNKIIPPQLNAVAPQYMCRGKYALIQLVMPGSEQLKFNLTVLFRSDKVNATQRETLLLWKHVRSVEKEVKKYINDVNIPVNTSMLRDDVEYIFAVTPCNALGKYGSTKQIPMRLTGSKSQTVQVVLVGADRAYADSEYIVEATLFSCDSQLLIPEKLSYMWSISENPVNVEAQKARRLRLAPGSLEGGKTYNITCTVLREGESTFQEKGELTLTTVERGISAVLSVSEFTLGTGQVLEIDASRSKDLDNKCGKLQFEWYCRTMENGACFLPKPGFLRLETEFSSEFNQAVLKLPAGSLPVGRYMFGVYVYKDTRKAHASAKIIVVPGLPPKINIILDTSKLVNPDEGVTIHALVTAPAGYKVQWTIVEEDGYEYFNLAGPLGLGDVTYLTEDTENRDIPLTIPGPITSWAGLKGDAYYKIGLNVIHPKKVNANADVVIRTNSPPVVKSIKVTPSSGEALKTKFTFETEKAYDSPSDFPLQYHYGYKVGESEFEETFKVSSDELQVQTVLFATTNGDTTIIPVLKVCDVHKTCASVEGDPITTKMPSEITPAEIEEIGKRFASLLSTQEYVEALGLAYITLQTLKEYPDQELYKTMASLVESGIQDAMKTLKASLGKTPQAMTESLNFLEMALSILEGLKVPVSEQTLQDLKDFKDKILSLISGNAGETMRYRKIVQARMLRLRKRSVSIVRKKKSALTSHHSQLFGHPVALHTHREKRDALGSKSDSLKPMTIEEVTSLLRVSELLIHSKNKTAEEEKKKLMGEVHVYMGSLCLSTVASSPATFIESSVVSFSVRQTKLRGKSNTVFYIPDGIPRKTKNHIDPGSMVLGGTLVQKYGNWICKDSPSPCDSVCISSSIFPEDYFSDGTNSAQQRLSSIFEVQFVNPITGGLVMVSGPLTRPMKIKIPLLNADIGTDQEMKCYAWFNRAWRDTVCSDGKIINNNPKMFQCSCTQLGYFAVFVSNPSATEATVPVTTTTEKTTSTTTEAATTTTEAATTTTEPTTTLKATTETTTMPTTMKPIEKQRTTLLTTSAESTTTTTTVKSTTILNTAPQKLVKRIAGDACNLTFWIDEDFNKKIGNREQEFLEILKIQIVNQTNMPEVMIVSITVNPGSIVVTVHLVDTDAKSVNDILPVIVKLLRDGNLNLEGLEHEHLNVPKQGGIISRLQRQRAENNDTVVYAVVSCVIFSALVVMALVTGAIIVKKKKQADKMRALQSSENSKIPTYREIQFEDSIDGTQQSLARYRNPNSLPTVTDTKFSDVEMRRWDKPIARTDRLPPVMQTEKYNDDADSKKSKGWTNGKKKKKGKKKVEKDVAKRQLIQNEEVPVVYDTNTEHDRGVIIESHSATKSARTPRWRTKSGREVAGLNDSGDFDRLPGTPSDEY